MSEYRDAEALARMRAVLLQVTELAKDSPEAFASVLIEVVQTPEYRAACTVEGMGVLWASAVFMGVDMGIARDELCRNLAPIYAFAKHATQRRQKGT